ncbi:general secretion pathway protein F [Collimonas sp. PA-H2]|uniref:type II secretion system F family protein n=1 Tax=Collimonas sp. PA-H2 TaxID=1881062 RepID=UPI000BF71F3B|nr:type II secretion system F family protein [Collimonas sp. PA-H2]PFH08592.1 general secretion pathway protein F [Collimonas sp. PA-H2]
MNNPPVTRVAEFDIVAKAKAGAMRSLRLAAIDAAAATRLAEREGLRVLSCTPHRNSFSWGGRGVAGVTRTRLDIALFAHELASLLDAGLGIIDALETLAEKERLLETRRVFEKMVQALKEGRNFSAVMGERPDVFPQLLVASISASEQTGDMAAALRRYSANFETLRTIRSKALGAAVYPLMLLGVGSLVVLFLLAVVVPKFSTLIESTRGEIPFASQVLIQLGKTIHAHPQLVAALFIGVFLALIWAIRHASRAGWNLPVLQRLPIVGPLIRMFRHAQFYRTSGMLIEGGIPVVRAFDMCGSLLTPEDNRKLVRAVASIREGGAIGPALQQVGLADPVALRMLMVAQRTGKLAEILARIAAFQEATLSRAIDVATRLFEPVLMLCIGLVIGAIVVLMYLPIFDLASSIQ